MLTGYYLDQYALGYLTQLILTAVVSLYLLSLPRQSPAARYFTLFFLAMTLYTGVSLVEATSIEARRIVAVFGQLITLTLATHFLVQFAYHFPRNEQDDNKLPPAQQREARFVSWLTAIGFLLVCGRGIYGVSQIRPFGWPSTSTPFITTGLAVAFCWTVIVFLRRSIYLSRQHQQTTSTWWWQHLRHPNSRLAAAPRAMAFAFLTGALLGLVKAVSEIFGIWLGLQEFIPSLGILTVLTVVSLIYINQMPARTTFMVKISGVALVTSFFILIDKSFKHRTNG